MIIYSYMILTFCLQSTKIFVKNQGVENRMKRFIGEKKIDDLNLRELIEFEKKLETLQPNVSSAHFNTLLNLFCLCL